MKPPIKALKKLLKRVIDPARIRWAQLNQYMIEVALKKAVADGHQIQVFFVVTQKQLWGGQSLFDELLADDRFMPTIIAMPNNEDKTTDPLFSANDNLAFFKTLKMPAVLGINSDGTLKSLDDFSRAPCLCFFDQPFSGLSNEWLLRNVAKQALICYIPYGFKIANAYQMHFNREIHNIAWKIFAETEWHRQQFIRLGQRKGNNVVVFGYPKFDEYTTLRATRKASHAPVPKPVIWAPHWSIRDTILGYSTFDKYHDYFTRKASASTLLNWVFKPHQRLRYHLAQCGFMTKQQVADYYQFWENGANTMFYDDPGYFDLFENSSALITDSGSFLAEYLPTGKPVLLLESDTTVGYNAFGQEIVNAYYKARTEDDIDRFIDYVVLGGNDPMKDQRNKIIDQVMPPGPETTGLRIKMHLQSVLGMKQ